MKKYIFLILLFIPLTSFLLNNDQINYLEKKKITKININKDFNTFFKDFQKNFEEKFILREKIIPINNYLNYKMGFSKDKNLFIGKDGYLFLTNINNITLKHRGILRDNPKKHREKIKAMKDLIDFFNSKGIKLIFIPVPNQQTIYQEKLPDWYKFYEESIYDIFGPEFKGKFSENYIDLRKTLKSDPYSYYKYEGHWNSKGMYLAYNFIMNNITNNIYQFQKEKIYWPKMHLKENFEGVDVIGSKNEYSKKDTILILGDSFSRPFIRLFKNDFSNVIRIDKDHERFEIKGVLSHNPKTVIIMIVERNFFDYDLLVSGLGNELNIYKTKN